MPDPNNSGGLGRRLPSNLDHMDAHPLRRSMIPDVPPAAPFVVNHAIRLPDMQHYWPLYDQGREGACVGFGSSWMMTLLNRKAYAARTLYLEAQKVDEWMDTPPEEGTSVRAAMDVLRSVGHWRSVYNRKTRLYEITGPHIEDGVEANKWTSSVDDVRACIRADVPCTIGINWYSDFDNPHWDSGLKRWIIGRDHTKLGRIRGGHSVCIRAASDRHGLVGGINNWGAPEVAMVAMGADGLTPTLVNGYPLFWMPYETLQRVLSEDGECTVVTDRTGVPIAAQPETQEHDQDQED